MTTTRKPWSRDELLVAFNLYCRTPFGKLHRLNPDIIKLAKIIQRTPSSVAMKLCNFASLDPVHKARGIKGLSSAAKADAEIFAEFARDWANLASESEEAMELLGVHPAPDDSMTVEQKILCEGPTEISRITKTRRVQGLFRATVLASYDFACAISGINIPELIVASHIVPWAKDEARRLDPRNGIALSALHDRAFDRGFISFDDSLRVIVSGQLRVGKPTELHRSALLAIEGTRIRLPSRYKPDIEAISFHREKIFLA